MDAPPREGSGWPGPSQLRGMVGGSHPESRGGSAGYRCAAWCAPDAPAGEPANPNTQGEHQERHKFKWIQVADVRWQRHCSALFQVRDPNECWLVERERQTCGNKCKLLYLFTDLNAVGGCK